MNSSLSVSKRIGNVPPSPIRKLVPFAQEAKKRGIKVYHLNIGDPDIKTPDVMLDVLKNWHLNPISYALSQGNEDFVQALLWYYKKLGYSFLNASNLQITLGGSEAISMALFACTNPGDEVLVFEPFYANYKAYVVVNGINLIALPTFSENGFHLPKKEVIEKAITAKTKAILYCSPNNPTGTVYEKEEIEMLVKVAKEHQLFLLSDEVYREFTYDNRQHTSLLSFMKEIPQQAIVLDSLSKRYSLCGARLGMVVSLNKDIMSGVLRMAMARLSAGFIDQTMAAQLVNVSDDYFSEVHKEYQTRRNVLYEGLKNIPGVEVPKPEGAFYTIATLPVKDTEDFCQWLLTDFSDNNETVMMAPAAGFYVNTEEGKNKVRIAYVLNVPSIKRCLELLKKALSTYHQLHSQ